MSKKVWLFAVLLLAMVLTLLKVFIFCHYVLEEYNKLPTTQTTKLLKLLYLTSTY